MTFFSNLNTFVTLRCIVTSPTQKQIFHFWSFFQKVVISYSWMNEKRSRSRFIPPRLWLSSFLKSPVSAASTGWGVDKDIAINNYTQPASGMKGGLGEWSNGHRKTLVGTLLVLHGRYMGKSFVSRNIWKWIPCVFRLFFQSIWSTVLRFTWDASLFFFLCDLWKNID